MGYLFVYLTFIYLVDLVDRIYILLNIIILGVWYRKRTIHDIFTSFLNLIAFVNLE